MGMIREDLVAERIAIDSYSQMIRYIGDSDPTTRTMLEGILATEAGARRRPGEPPGDARHEAPRPATRANKSSGKGFC